MAWAWVRPADPTLLDARPLLDLGTGDAATLRACAERPGLAVGVDASLAVLRAARRSVSAPLLAGIAQYLPFRGASFETILAGDLFHHLNDEVLEMVIAEIRRALRPTGRVIAWWYERPGRPSPDAPAYPRSYDAVAALLDGFEPSPLALELTVEPAPPTVGIRATRIG